MNLVKTSLISSLIVASLTGCATYRHPTTDFVDRSKDEKGVAVQEKASKHWLYNVIPRDDSQLKPYDARFLTYALAGNKDDGIFGERYPYSTNINFGTFCAWNLRNPLHNFNSYIIGSADRKEHTSFSLFELGNKNFEFMHSTKNAIFYGEKCGLAIKMHDSRPFVSLHAPIFFTKKEFQFYFGWRPDGRFGGAGRVNDRKGKKNKK